MSTIAQIMYQHKAGLSFRERELMDLFISQERVVITTEDVRLVWPHRDGQINSILSRLAKKGWLQRLKRGTFAPIPLGEGTDQPAIANAWAVASLIFSPCFISGWSAAEHWGLTDQIFNAISLVTGKRPRLKNQEIGGIKFQSRTHPKERLFGFEKIWFGSTVVMVADPHRTVIDILDAPSFGGGGRHVLDILRNYWIGSDKNPDLLLQYAIRFKRGVVFKRLGFSAEAFGSPSPEWLHTCEENISSGVSLLDPSSPQKGKIITKWGLRINIPVEAA